MTTPIQWRRVAETILKVVVLGVTVGAIYALVANGLLEPALSHPVIAGLLFDCFLIHISTNSSRGETVTTAAIALAAYAAELTFDPAIRSFSSKSVSTAASFLGVASLLVLSVRSLQLPGKEGRSKLRTYGVSSIFLCMAIWSIPFLKMATEFRPRKLDLFLYAFDAGFGVQPSFALGQLFAAHPTLLSIETIVYMALAVPVALVYIGHLRSAEKLPIDILMLFIVNAGIGYLCFLIFPAAGPTFAFPGQYPMAPPSLAVLHVAPVVISAVPNAMPSVHVSTALLVWFNSRPWRIGRWLALAFLAATLVSTLGLGEHYLIDVVVAFPYAVFIQALAMTREGRRQAMLICGLLTAAWLLLLGFGHALFPMPVLALGAAPVTVAVALWQEQRLSTLLYVQREGRAVTSTLARRFPGKELTAAEGSLE